MSPAPRKAAKKAAKKSRNPSSSKRPSADQVGMQATLDPPKLSPAANIHGRAMLVRLSVSVWTARKYDRKVTDEVNKQHAAGKDAGRFNKHLFGGKDSSKSHAAVVAAASAARTAHYANTLPWADEGWRLLPTANYFEYTETIRKTKAAFETAVAEFMAEYPDLRENARRLLNGMYKEEDYPTASKLASAFACSTEFAPVPAAGDFRLDLPADKLGEIEESTTARVQRATADAMRDAWGRLASVVEKLGERLSEPDAIFRDSLIGNVSEMTSILTRLNITDDPALEGMRARVEERLANLNPDSLRTNKKLRAAVAKEADDILKSMSGLYGPAQ